MQVTTDAATHPKHRRRLLEVDVDAGRRTRIQDPMSSIDAASVITVTATSPGLTSHTIDIPVSIHAETHAVLAVAANSILQEQKWSDDSPIKDNNILRYV